MRPRAPTRRRRPVRRSHASDRPSAPKIPNKNHEKNEKNKWSRVHPARQHVPDAADPGSIAHIDIISDYAVVAASPAVSLCPKFQCGKHQPPPPSLHLFPSMPPPSRRQASNSRHGLQE
ncbi:hypothetical protein B0H10DRAFT_2428476 [Mycena sp. CBHHK59/15]|nr:hypothetical protein B0H10DRAFT_2428476 [Mycena sp. CBHHK59/15]